MINVEKLIIDWLGHRIPEPVFADVPSERPESFVALERTGGARDSVVLDRSSIAIQCWAKSRIDASELAMRIDEIILMLVDEPSVCKVSRESLYNFPGPNGEPRYQLTLSVTTR